MHAAACRSQPYVLEKAQIEKSRNEVNLFCYGASLDLTAPNYRVSGLNRGLLHYYWNRNLILPPIACC